MATYHVALSFAGEDRTYVEQVATLLRAVGIDVFYDLFEEADLWGKNLYTHLSDVYQNKALFTVMFVSEAYRTKLWMNRERESAQPRAFADSSEYILPAFFDD
ncbi:MAG: TIR domain-containing protein [Gammaproteobacteria bacterium]